MIPVLIALVVLVGAICVLDLILTLGVIRRLRTHSELLSKRPMGLEPPDVMLAEGERVEAFEATTTDGEPVSRDLLAGTTLVAVVSPDCPACHERLPGFLSHAQSFPGGRQQVLAVIVGSEEETAEQREKLEPVARVVVEPHQGSIATALKVGGFPAFGKLDSDGTVLASGLDFDQLDTAAARV